MGGAPRALVPGTPRRPSRACACQSIPSRTRAALYLPFLDLRKTTRALASTCTRPLPSCKLSQSSGIACSTRLGVARREGRRIRPPPFVMSHAWIRLRITTDFRQRPGYPASITFHIRNRLFMLFLRNGEDATLAAPGGG
jgi:hypothetical protein